MKQDHMSAMLVRILHRLWGASICRVGVCTLQGASGCSHTAVANLFDTNLTETYADAVEKLYVQQVQTLTKIIPNFVTQKRLVLIS